MIFLQYGSNLQARDKEGLTPLDIVMKDRLPHVEFLTTGRSVLVTGNTPRMAPDVKTGHC